MKDVGLTSRIDIIGLNGNDGSHYIVEKIAKIIAGDKSDEVMGGVNKGKKRWELYLNKAHDILDLLENR